MVSMASNVTTGLDLSGISDLIIAFVPIMLLITVVGWVVHTIRENL